MLDALGELERSGRQLDARLALAPSLDDATRRWLRDRAADAGVAVFEVSPDAGAGEWLAAFDATLATSGTVTLESALAGAPPVIVYQVSAVTAAIARRLVRAPSIGLPNVLLGRRVYPELLQDDAVPARMARSLATVLDQRAAFEPHARVLRDLLLAPLAGRRASHERIAAWMSDWLDPAR